ncbi:ATP-binding protein [Streptomyces sp. RY43-2]|uniref:ATP-binding protein n=1 Tax=Streptomyces macrolidinus TaxID=2952607 RepID=A0ABT0ZHC7_9ACTN|nr:ATP-binding protein [Streptomyces macrolidinus]MCN9242992.1 ATP-binding protein [Streptomyces macrolidinus]
MNQKSAEGRAWAQHHDAVPDFTALLSSTPRGARLARLLAADQLRNWGIPAEPATHIVAELAANAATHGRLPGRSFRLTLYVVGRTLRIEVTDTRGDRLPELQVSDVLAESGRGLLLVDALADRWHVEEGRFPRKTVWAELDLRTPDPAPACSGRVSD